MIPQAPVNWQNTQPAFPTRGFAGQSSDWQNDVRAIAAVVGPDYVNTDRFQQTGLLGIQTAGNSLTFDGYANRSASTTSYVMEKIDPALQEILTFFKHVPLDPNTQSFERRIVVFGSSKWQRVTDLMTGNSDTMALFKSRVFTQQFAKSAEIDVKRLRDPDGARLWYMQLDQAALGFLNTLLHVAIDALMKCMGSNLGQNNNSGAPPDPTINIPLYTRIRRARDQFGILTKGQTGLQNLGMEIDTLGRARDMNYTVAVMSKRVLDGIQKTMTPGPLENWREIGPAGYAGTYITTITGIQKVLAVGPVSVGPNTPKVNVFSRVVNVLVHNIVTSDGKGATHTEFRTYNRFTDGFEDVKMDHAHVLNLSSHAVNHVDVKLLVFTLYGCRVSATCHIATNTPDGPELHLSNFTDCVSLFGAQLKVSYNAVFSVAAHIPNPNTVAFVECAYLEEVTGGGGTTVQNLSGGNAFSPSPLPTSRFAIAVNVEAKDGMGVMQPALTGFNNDTTILSLIGVVPANVALGERNPNTWVPDFKAHGTDEAKFHAKFGNMLANVTASPMSPLRTQQSRFQIPVISTEEYTQELSPPAAAGNPPVLKGEAREGNNWFGRHTYASCMADMKQEVGANGFLRPKRSMIMN